MRIIIHEYANGERYAYSTTNDGEFLADLEGTRRVGARIKAAVELSCDDNDDGKQAVERALQDAASWVKRAA